MQRSSSLFKSFIFAIEGIKVALKYNRNLKIHFLVAIFVLFLSLYLQINKIEQILLLIMIILVITSEMINSVIEEMVNLIIKEHSAEAKIAKDVAAGMVLVASVGALVVGLLIFLPYLT